MTPRLPVRKTYKLFIGGAFPRSESGRTLELEGHNVARASRKDLDNAIAAALRDGHASLARFRQYDGVCRAEFGARVRLNSLILGLMYRPRLLSLAIRTLSRRPWLLDSLVKAVCLPRPAFKSELTPALDSCT